MKGIAEASDWGITRSLTGKSLLKHELVSEEEWKRGREGLRLDVKAQEADGEGDRALPRSEPGKELALIPRVASRHAVRLLGLFLGNSPTLLRQ